MSDRQELSMPSGSGPARRDRRGSATVALSGGGGGDDVANALDPATRSLADALRIMYRLLQGLMLVVAAAYLLSGFQSIGVTERGVRTTFGRVVGTNLGPGFQWSWPAPIGELLKVGVTDQEKQLRSEFFVKLNDNEEKNLLTDGGGVTALYGGGPDALDPDSDGMLLTGDGGIAHGRFSIRYARRDPARFISGIDPKHEEKIIAAAVRRGIVQAAAGVTVDELITNQLDSDLRGGDARRFQDIALANAQRILDRMESDGFGTGLRLESLTMERAMPPRRVGPSFNQVQSAQTEAKSQVERASEFRDERLVETAGDSASLVLAWIDRYEADLAKGDQAAASRTLATIDSIMLGEATRVEGVEVVPRVFGEVSNMLAEARQYRTTAANRARADRSTFLAKLATYRSNPRVMIAGEWTSAMSEFMARPSVQTMVLPPNADRVIVQINRDPDVARQQQIERYQREFDEAARKRGLEQQRQRFQDRADAETKRASQ